MHTIKAFFVKSYDEKPKICRCQSRAEKSNFDSRAKLCIPSTLNIDLILWHIQLIVCAENIKSWFKSWAFHFTFQAFTLPHKFDIPAL